ncbi:VanZ family protein [Bacillus timonensis]|uniref:VanZ family protein n=1 Tax=Bacillus timonensis TaxID=1033734 RepID=UPI000289A49E|nr:VanZ family protein [Bacillus timonensis]
MSKIVSWIALILWISIIFNMSHQPSSVSNELSKGITEVFVHKVETLQPNEDFKISEFNHIVRKNAHFFIYLVLGLLQINALNRSKVRGILGITFAFILCVIYAIFDEVHQLFVPGRGAQVFDVLIDSAGTVTGIGIYLLISKIVKTFRVLNLYR